MKKVILFDAKYLLYRQHFAHKALSAGTFPTGGMFGFWKEVYRMQELWPGWSMVFCWDGQGPTWRDGKKKLTGYKENREITPDTILVQKQEPVLRSILSQMGFWVPKIDGVEGDDVISVLSGSWKGEKEILIYSGDQDMYQLVGPGVQVFSPRKIKQGKNEPPADLILNEKIVEKVMGVVPSQVSELRAMAGDPADNLKGLPGIGPKKAFDLYSMGARPSKAFTALPYPVQMVLGMMRKDWERVRQEYEMVQLPRTPKYLGYTPDQQEQLEQTVLDISTAPERQRRNKDERERAWLVYLGRYEMKELFEERNRVWRVP